MRRLALVGLTACSASSELSRPPDRQSDVLIEAPAEVTVIYRDGEGAWQLARQVGNRRGFDLELEHYAVAFLDASTGSIESIYTTRTEQVDFVRGPEAPEAPRHHVTGNVVGLGEFGGTIAVGSQSARLVDGSATLDVPDGLHTIAAGTNAGLNSGEKIGALAVRRDVLLQEPLELEIDLDAEALPTTELYLEPTDCQYRSTYMTGGTAIKLGELGRRVITPHGTQWQAADELAVRLVCPFGVYQTSLFHSLGEVPRVIELASIGGFGSFNEQTWQFEWTAIELPAPPYRGVLGGYPCDASQLQVEEYASCQQLWRMDVTAGWTAATGARSLPPIAPADLEAIGVWDPALAL